MSLSKAVARSAPEASRTGAVFVLSKVLRSALVGSAIAALSGFAALPAAAQDYTHPKAMDLPAPVFERPDPEALRLRLDNGLVAYVAEDHRAPLATITAYLPAGRGHGEPGAATALAAALRRGPAEMETGGFRQRLQALFAEYAVTVHAEETTVRLDVPAEQAWAAADLLARILRAPAFDGGVVKASAPAAVAGGIDYSYTLKTAVAQFEDSLFAGHPFGAAAAADADLLEAARRLHRERIRAGNVVLAFAGDFDARRARRELEKAFGGLPARVAPAAPASFPALDPRQGRELLLKDAARDQGWVVIGHELPIVPEADRAALEVMDYILGAYHLDSRLYRNSRELRGLTNDNSSFLQPGVRGPGAYSFRTYGRPEAVRLLVDITFRELERIRDSLPTADELFVAKGALVDGLYARRYATGLDAANAYAREWLHYGSHERSEAYPKRIAAVTAENVQAMARKYIHPERMIVSVVGPLDRIRSAEAIEGEPQLEVWGRP